MMSTKAHKSMRRADRSLRGAVDRVLAERGQPTAWSAIMTVLGDAVVPRGGRIWTGSLLEILALLGFGGGVLRTALSRLVADGWLQASKTGRRSFYELTPHGRAETIAAARRIYRIHPPAWDGIWQVAIVTEGDAVRRAAVRNDLAALGFVGVGPDTLVRVGAPVEAGPVQRGAVVISGEAADPAGARELAARAWSLAEVADGYRELERAIGPVLDADVPAEGSEADALAARILLVHELRRVVLRDPDLPEALLPAGWIGGLVRGRVARCYHTLLAPSERWLTTGAVGEDGPLPAADRELERRFTT